MPADIIPMLCSPIEDAAIDDLLDLLEVNDEWVFDQKCDGQRRLVKVACGQVYPMNRSGGPTTLPSAMVRAFAAQQLDFTVDGELVGVGRDKQLWLYDLPQVTGLITPDRPWEERHAALETLHASLALDSAGIHLLPSADTTGRKRWLRHAVKASGAEGLVVKHRDHPYLSGRRSRLSLKAKWRKTVDCVVTGVRIDGRDNIGLGVYDTDGTLVDIGEVTAAAGDGRRIVAAYQADGPKLTVEVTYLNVDRSNRLYQPTLPKLRGSDKRAAECTLDQLDAGRVSKIVLVEEGLHAAGA